MSEVDNLPSDYQHDVIDQLAKQPHGILAGWVLVALLVLTSVVVFGVDHFLPMDAADLSASGAATALRQNKAGEAAIPLAEELGLFSKHGK